MHIAWNTLAESLRTEPYILSSRITPENLARAYGEGRAVVQKRRDRIVGFSALWKTSDEEWHELGTLWVHPDFRGRGIATVLFRECTAKMERGGLFLITAHAAIIAIARQDGWDREEGDWRTVKLWNRICEPWNRYPEGASVKPPGTLYYRIR